MLNKFTVVIAPIATIAIIVAVNQYLQVRQLQQALVFSDEQQASLQQHIEQLESNLHSAGVQMQNLSNIAQEASVRAATCEQAD